MITVPLSRRLTLVVSLLVLAGCGADSSGSPRPSEKETASPTASDTAEAASRIGLPVETGATVEGLIEVDGHDIYARCSGTGQPTIVYFTGWAPDLSKRGVSVIGAIETV